MIPYPILLDSVGVVAGSLLGILVGKKLRPEIQEHMMLYFGGITLAIGISLLCKGGNLSVAVIALVLGGMLGELIRIDDRIHALISWLQKNSSAGRNQSNREGTDLFLNAVVLIVLSTSGMLGAMTGALTGDYAVLITKTVMDFSSCVFFAMITGPIMMAAAVPLFVILMLFYLLAGMLQPVISTQMTLDFCACGGIMLLLNGLGVAGIKKIPVSNLIPALVLVMPISALWSFFF